jgi:hypothetical protein
MTQENLDRWLRPSREQDDRFREVQVGARRKYPQETELLKTAAMRLARENGKVYLAGVELVNHRGRPKAVPRFAGGFTAPEMVEEAHLEGKVPRWLPGSVCGWLSDAGVIQVGLEGKARENSSNGSRKGAKINRWELAEKAVAEVPEPTAPGVPSGR